jgi:predicted TIM-barrel fold metal-dependent hydrolase
MPLTEYPIFDAHVNLGKGSYYSLSPEELLEQMDHFGVQAAVVCPTDEGIGYHFERENDYILEAAQRFPARLLPFLTAQPWAPKEGLKYLEAALRTGLTYGLNFDSSLVGCRISDPKFVPFVEFAEANQLPIYFHTGTPIHALPTQLMLLANQYPKVHFIMGHMGFPDFWTDGVPVAEITPNIYLETSYFGVAPLLISLVERIGADRILFGSDLPICSYSLEINKILILQLGKENELKIFSRNLQKLLEKAKVEDR